MISARRIIAALVPVLLLFNCLPTTAATIVKAPGRRVGSVVVSVSGELTAGDENRFVQTAGTVANGVVDFDSPGGNLLAGIEIGEVIHFKHFETLVPNGSACASACALAWLGGATRLIGATGRIGFHQPYIRNSGVVSGSASLNAVVRAYLNELGLSAVAIQYITETPPENVKWLGFLEARRVGIEVFRAGQLP